MCQGENASISSDRLVIQPSRRIDCRIQSLFVRAAWSTCDRVARKAISADRPIVIANSTMQTIGGNAYWQLTTNLSIRDGRCGDGRDSTRETVHRTASIGMDAIAEEDERQFQFWIHPHDCSGEPTVSECRIGQ